MKLQANISRLEEIVGDDTETKRMLLRLFVESCDNCIGRMQAAVAADSDKQWNDAVHEMKGAAYNLGFDDLADYCVMAEKNSVSATQRLDDIKVMQGARDSIKELLLSF